MYTPAGYMPAQIQSAGRPKYDRPVASGGTIDQAAVAALGYLICATATSTVTG
ncbi:hypothetical protein MSHI_14710 [Mycobacterium shinjukuense]|uniref:Uncharacterized protein n=2 Tax=Mycobacterium shinjukuense TaxID=398694 RepID=A0A7I7MMY8_9MYCO|nr:lipocalin-like domain-containing protein [Mycobacterium shinjukuense]BBX73565.1 hypothetical protein MSHI_14710 [Mycobacterium shinjukuense]